MNKLYLNLGCGNRLLQKRATQIWADGLREDCDVLITEFVEHDLRLHRPEVDVAHDLNVLPWPWPDERFRRIEAWAVFEHLQIDLVQAMDECWRILMPGGKLHVKVPYWKHPRAWKDPQHRWRYAKGVFDYFDPRTKYGSSYEAYSPFKWRILDKGWNDGKRSGLVAYMQKILSDEQWEATLSDKRPRRQGFVIWLTGRSQAGKSTLARGLQLLFPHCVIVDDETYWHSVWQHTYKRATAKEWAVAQNHEKPTDPHADFALELAYVARVLADQGHMVVVSMVGSPESRRKRIQTICDPYWIYIKRDEGEHKKPYYDKPKTWYARIDHDKLGKRDALAQAAKVVAAIRRKMAK